VYYLCRATPLKVQSSYVPKGFAGTMATVGHITRLILEGAKDMVVRRAAVQIFRAQGIAPKHYLGEIAALFYWVQKKVRYTRDIYRVELLHSARRMLQLRAGDCDDMTILLGALLESTGHPVRLVLIGSDPRKPRRFSHIFLEVQHADRWVTLDASMNRPMGWTPNAPVRQVVPLRPTASSHSARPRHAG